MVRKAKKENLKSLEKILTKEEFVTILEGETWYYLLDGKEVSFLTLTNGNQIIFCYTKEEYRGKGAAKELFEAIKPILLARGNMEILISQSSEVSEFFQSLGFSPVKGRPLLRYHF